MNAREYLLKCSSRKPMMMLPAILFVAILSCLTPLPTNAFTLDTEQIIVGATGATTEYPLVAIQNQGRQAQAVYPFTIPSNTANANSDALADIRFTTCVPEDLSTVYTLESSVIYILDRLPFEGFTTPLAPVAESGSDCGGRFATLDFRAELGKEYFIVVTSFTGRGSSFRLEASVRSSPPTPTPLPWGLDRIDQRSLPLDKEYSVAGLSGETVYVYVLDSGVRVSHAEFDRGNGERNAIHGADMVERLEYATDCSGHGTHVAAKIAGKSYGVAKDSVIISVRVTGCSGAGITSRMIEGLEFVLDDTRLNNRFPAVVAMSLSTAKNEVINKYVQKLSVEGIPVVTAAGNSNEDSCNFSPASEPNSITVAASNRDDSKPTFSNSGVCVDLFAPGQEILSAWHTGDHAYRVESGTSFACPHVVGAVAIILSANPDLPSEALANMLYSAATFKAVGNHSVTSTNTDNDKESHMEALNNRLLYVRPIPSLSLERPPKDYMYIYTAYNIHTGAVKCSEGWLGFEARRQATAKILASLSETEPEDVSFWTCCPNSPNQDRCGVSTSLSTRVFTQISSTERLASGTFNTLEAELLVPKNLIALRTAFGSTHISVAIESWVVDSDGNVFWTAPDLRADKSEWPSTGVLIAIIMSSIVLLIITAVAAYTFFRNSREAREDAENETAVAQHLEEKADQDAIQPMDKLFDPSTPREYMGFMRENSAFRGNALDNLTPNASMRTLQPTITRGPFSMRSGLMPSMNSMRFSFGTPSTAAGPAGASTGDSSRDIMHQLDFSTALGGGDPVVIGSRPRDRGDSRWDASRRNRLFGGGTPRSGAEMSQGQSGARGFGSERGNEGSQNRGFEEKSKDVMNISGSDLMSNRRVRWHGSQNSSAKDRRFTVDGQKSLVSENSSLGSASSGANGKRDERDERNEWDERDERGERGISEERAA